MEHALRLASPHHAHQLLPHRGGSRAHGSTPWPEVLSWIDEQERLGWTHTAFQSHRASAHAAMGRFDEAERLFDEVVTGLRERGAVLHHAMLTAHLGIAVFEAAGDLERAEALGREGCRMLEELGERELALDRVHDARRRALRARRRRRGGGSGRSAAASSARRTT